MEIFTHHDLRQLIEPRQRPCVSVYMPTHETGSETRQDPIRCKNLLTQAEERLIDHGLASTAARAMLKDAWQLQDDSNLDFWRHQSAGLALFVDPSTTRYFRVPVPFDEHVSVGERYFVKPLLPLLEGDGRFYVLAVSQNQVRLLQASRFTVSPLSPDVLPKNLVDALNIDEYMTSIQHENVRTGAANLGAPALFHGHGGSNMDRRKNDELIEYFRRLDDALQEFFGPERSPLVFAGVDYLFPIFKQSSHYRNLVDTPITGSPEAMSDKELHERAWKIVEPLFQTKQRAALEQYGDRAARNLASDDLQEILAAACEGAVEVLFLARGASVWGDIASSTGEICEHDEPTPQSRDLLEFAAGHTLSNSGSVYLLDQDKMPTAHAAAAVLRYPVTWPARSSR